jgi:phosphatidylinositol alpha-mannosyltransferase
MLVPAHDPKAWANAIVGLIENPARRALMQIAGLRKALKYSWPSVAQQVMGVYERVLR